MSENPYESPSGDHEPRRLLRARRFLRSLRIVAGGIAIVFSLALLALGVSEFRRGMSPEFANASFNPLPQFGVFASGIGVCGVIVGYFLLRTLWTR
ncbi:hypothetical protein ACFL2H_08575 [Planctomycetota bacterium]